MIINKYFLRPVFKAIKNGYDQITEINKKYATPQIKNSKLVFSILLLIRIYLIFLIGLLIYKFYLTVIL